MRTHTFSNGVTVTDYGQVYSPSGKRLKQTTDAHGYKTVAWKSSNYRRHSIPVHQLVATAFIPNEWALFRQQVDHINGYKWDNRATNLRWVDCSMNNKEKFALRVRQGKPRFTDKELAARKKHGVKVQFAGDTWESITDMANFYHISATAIRKALQRGTWCGKPITRVA